MAKTGVEWFNDTAGKTESLDLVRFGEFVTLLHVSFGPSGEALGNEDTLFTIRIPIGAARLVLERLSSILA